MTTVRQLAQLAGVSIASVSRALNGKPDVRPEVRKRICELAELYQYRSNRLAQGVLTGKSGTIGCLIPQVRSPFFSRLLQGVLDEAFAAGFEVTTLSLGSSDIIHTCKALETLIEKRVEGILVASGSLQAIPRRALLEIWSNGIIPVALQMTPTASPIDHVAADEKCIADLTVEYLVGLGHCKLLYLGPFADGIPQQRILRLQEAAQRHTGLTISFLNTALYRTDMHVLEGVAQVSPLPSAIATWNDKMAAHILQFAVTRGLKVPDDLSVLSCSAAIFREAFIPPLTSIDACPEDIGREAARLLFRRLTEKADPGTLQPETILIPPRLLQGGSCASPHTQ